MTRDNIIRMAQEAGGAIYEVDWCFEIENLERFASIVAAAEREECAKVCDEMHEQWRWGSDDPHSGPADCAAAIRARGEFNAP